MMEPATEKQLKFMSALNLEPFPNISKQAAKEMIAAKLAEDEMAKPEVVKFGNVPPAVEELIKNVNKSNGKEYHLSIEECRARALECAISVAKNKDYTNEEFDMAKDQYFNWIWQGE